MLPFDENKPAYALEQVQWLVGQGEITCVISEAAILGGDDLKIDRAGIVDVVLSLTSDDFYKTMEAELRPGLWQDVYRRSSGEVELYIKLQIDRSGRAVVIQFKQR